MAYVTCPGCRTPQLVGDETTSYACFTCYEEVRFHACSLCGFTQAVAARWKAYTCGKCEKKVDLPRAWGRADSAQARRAEGVASPFPKL